MCVRNIQERRHYKNNDQGCIPCPDRFSVAGVVAVVESWGFFAESAFMSKQVCCLCFYF